MSKNKSNLIKLGLILLALSQQITSQYCDEGIEERRDLTKQVWLRTGQGYELSREPQIRKWIKEEAYKYGPQLEIKYVGEEPRLVQVEIFEKLCYKQEIVDDTTPTPILGEKKLVTLYKIEEFSEEQRLNGLSGPEIETLLEEKEIFKLTQSQLEQWKLQVQNAQEQKYIEKQDKMLEKQQESHINTEESSNSYQQQENQFKSDL
eukprot:403359296